MHCPCGKSITDDAYIHSLKNTKLLLATVTYFKLKWHDISENMQFILGNSKS